jgi:DNA repair protein RadA
MRQKAIAIEEEAQAMEAEESSEKFKTKKGTPDTMVKPEKKPITVEDLPGVGPASAEKLAMSGFDTVLAIAVATPGELVEAAGVSEAVARRIICAARDGLDMGFQTGLEVLEKRNRMTQISLGASNIDNIMGGGVHTGAITEFFGAYGSGKTQFGHMLACQAIKADPESHVIYIDTENTFRPGRVYQFAQGLGLEPEKVLANIKVARAFNSDHQMLLVDKAEELIKQGLKVKLVVVDSLTAHFRAEFVGRGTLAERQQKLNKHMHALSKLADMYNLSVYVTNQVMAKPDMFFGDPTEAIGGNIVGHNSTYRVYLRRGKKGTRVAKLVDAPDLPDAECIVLVTETGIQNAG